MVVVVEVKVEVVEVCDIVEVVLRIVEVVEMVLVVDRVVVEGMDVVEVMWKLAWQTEVPGGALFIEQTPKEFLIIETTL